MYVTSRQLSPAVFIQSARRPLIAGGMAIFSAIQVLYAQTTADTSAELALIGAAMSLRQEALSGPKESFDQFNQLISGWDSLGIDEVGRHGVLLNIWAYSAIQGAGSRRVLKAAKRTYQTDTLPFDAAGIQVIKERELLADLIFIRQTFHHFKYKNLMLESIKASLRPGGEVIVVESVSDDFEKEEMPCAETVSMAEILKHFEDHRFSLVKKEKIGEQWLFRWKK